MPVARSRIYKPKDAFALRPLAFQSWGIMGPVGTKCVLTKAFDLIQMNLFLILNAVTQTFYILAQSPPHICNMGTALTYLSKLL